MLNTDAVKTMADYGRNYFTKIRTQYFWWWEIIFQRLAKKMNDIWASRKRWTTSIWGLGFQSRDSAPYDPIDNVEPAEDVLRTSKLLLSAEPAGTANNPIDDCLSAEPNIDYFDTILGCSPPPKAAKPLNTSKGGLQ